MCEERPIWSNARVGGGRWAYWRCEMVMLLLTVLAAWLGASLPVGVLMGRALRLAQVGSTPAPPTAA